MLSHQVHLWTKASQMHLEYQAQPLSEETEIYLTCLGSLHLHLPPGRQCQNRHHLGRQPPTVHRFGRVHDLTQKQLCHQIQPH